MESQIQVDGGVEVEGGEMLQYEHQWKWQQASEQQYNNTGKARESKINISSYMAKSVFSKA